MKIALVLQGGGARGIFTSGVLDGFLKANIKVDHVYAVSAGGLNAMNYISEQIGRNRKAASLTFRSIKNVVRKRTFIDFDYYFNKLNETLPFDLEKYNNSKTKFTVVATSLKTGKAHYFNKDIDINFNECIKASASIPLVAKEVKINDEYFLDGGDSDPIPYEKAFNEGYDKVILITTRTLDFRKKPKLDGFIEHLYRLKYKNYPEYLTSLLNSHENYNDEFEKLKKYSKDKLFIVAPNENIDLKHLERNDEKLEYYYNLGLKEFENIKEKLSDFIR